MSELDFIRIKNKIMSVEPSRYWGDDFDVRFYLLSKIKDIKQSSILDLGGGIGTICSELNDSNFIVNIDLAFEDLKLCKKNNQNIESICSSITHLPFREMNFDYIICAHVLELAKNEDMVKKQTTSDSKNTNYPTLNRIVSEIFRVLTKDGIVFFTTPNNIFYKTIKLEYTELKIAISSCFSNYKLYFYNTFPRISRKYRKMNLANVFPKLLSKILSRDKILLLLLKKDEGMPRSSVSFYVEVRKN